MTIKMWGYQKCGTCRSAQKWLQQHKIAHQSIDIIHSPPTLAELSDFVARSGCAIHAFFNTSGELYRAFQLKERLKDMDDEQKLALLAEHGKLIKRPLIADDTRLTLGFKEQQFQQVWGAQQHENES